MGKEGLGGEQVLALAGPLDREAWHLLAARQVSLARDVGAPIVLPISLTSLSDVLILMGDFAAAALIAEAEEILEATGSQLHLQPYAAL